MPNESVKREKLNDQHVKPDEYAKLTKQFKDNWGKAKKNKEQEAQKLKDKELKEKGKKTEHEYRYATEIKAAIRKKEAESMVPSDRQNERGELITLSQDHENDIKHKLDDSKQTTYEDFRTAMMSLLGLYFKMVADFNHTFDMFASYLREFIVENTFLAATEGPIDKIRHGIETGINKLADLLSDSDVDYNLVANDIAAVVSYEMVGGSPALMITLSAEVSNKLSPKELELLKTSLGSVVRNWLKEEGYEKTVNGSYQNAVGDKLTVQKFNELRDKPLGLGHYLSSHMQIIAPQDVEELSNGPAPAAR